MNTTILVVLAGAVGAVVGSIVEHGLKARRENWKQHLAFALVGFAMASSVVDTLALAHKVDAFQARLDAEDLYMRAVSNFSAAAREAEQARSPLVRSVFQNRLRDVNIDLKTIVTMRSLNVPHDEIINTWRQIVGGAKRCVLATNLASAAAWQTMSRDNGLALQKAARSRGVQITRIYLSGSDGASQKRELDAVKSAQEAAGIHVLELPATWTLSNPTYRGYVEKLGSADIVLVDNEIALCTRLDPSNNSIINASVTYNDDQIETAKEFFRRLLQESGSALPDNCR